MGTFLADTMPTIEQVRPVIEDYYRQNWLKWFEGRPEFQPARIEVRELDGSSCYSRTDDHLAIFISAWNLEDRDVLDTAGWPSWRSELIHEMLHEWQLKTLTPATKEATHLMTLRPANFPGPNHDATFYQALIDKAALLDMTPEELLPRI
jgi:hypothetical protein